MRPLAGDVEVQADVVGVRRRCCATSAVMYDSGIDCRRRSPGSIGDRKVSVSSTPAACEQELRPGRGEGQRALHHAAGERVVGDVRRAQEQVGPRRRCGRCRSWRWCGRSRRSASARRAGPRSATCSGRASERPAGPRAAGSGRKTAAREPWSARRRRRPPTRFPRRGARVRPARSARAPGSSPTLAAPRPATPVQIRPRRLMPSAGAAAQAPSGACGGPAGSPEDRSASSFLSVIDSSSSRSGSGDGRGVRARWRSTSSLRPEPDTGEGPRRGRAGPWQGPGGDQRGTVEVRPTTM